MYCKNCGNEVNNGEQVCPTCGARVDFTGESTGSRKSVNINFTVPDLNEIKGKTGDMKENFLTGADALGKNKMLFFANLALLVLSMIFSFTGVLKVSADSLDVSNGATMFDSWGGVWVFMVIMYIVSAVVLLIPLLMNKKWSTKFYLPAKITTILSALMFILAIIVDNIQIQNYGYSSLMSLSITATGWLFILATAGALVLTFKLSMDLKKAKNSQNQPNYPTHY